eukprot:gene7920-5533_t
MSSNAPTKQPTASRAKPATRVAASGSTPRHRTQPADPPASTYRPGSFAAKATTNPKPHRSAGSAQQPSSQPQPQPVVVEVEDVPGGDSTGALKPTAVPTIVSGHRPVDVQEARLVRRDGGGGTQREVRVDEATKARAFRQRDAAGNQMYGYSYNSADDPTFQQRHGGGMHVQSSCMDGSEAGRRRRRPDQASLGAPPSRSPTTTTTAAARTASTTKTGPGPCSTAGRAWAWIQCGGTPSGSALPTGRLMQRMMAGGGMFGGFDDDDFFFGSSPMLGMMGMMGGRGQQRRGQDNFFDDDFLFRGPMMGGRCKNKYRTEFQVHSSDTDNNKRECVRGGVKKNATRLARIICIIFIYAVLSLSLSFSRYPRLPCGLYLLLLLLLLLCDLVLTLFIYLFIYLLLFHEKRG